MAFTFPTTETGTCQGLPGCCVSGLCQWYAAESLLSE
jgi:hypothetical protein